MGSRAEKLLAMAGVNLPWFDRLGKKARDTLNEIAEAALNGSYSWSAMRIPFFEEFPDEQIVQRSMWKEYLIRRRKGEQSKVNNQSQQKAGRGRPKRKVPPGSRPKNPSVKGRQRRPETRRKNP